MSTTPLALLEAEASNCVSCRLSEGRTHVVFGVGDPHADLMFVGEGPGRDEDLAGEPFVGRSGQLLDQLVLEELGLARSSFYIANVVKCRPPQNRDPLEDEVAACQHYLMGQVGAIDPRVVVTLGNFATRALLGVTEGITRLRGRSYPFGRGVLVPTFHPAAALRGGGVVVAQIRADLVRAKQALTTGRAGVIGVFLPDESATARLGGSIAGLLEPGDVVLLSGELGAGKTTLTKGLVASLGGTTAVTSPTFTLCHLYDTTPPVAHVDCWRLDSLAEVVDLALEEILDEGGVCVIEWGERVLPMFSDAALHVELSPDGDGESRVAVLSPRGARFAGLLPELLVALRRSGLAAEMLQGGASDGPPR